MSRKQAHTVNLFSSDFQAQGRSYQGQILPGGRWLLRSTVGVGEKKKPAAWVICRDGVVRPAQQIAAP